MFYQFVFKNRWIALGFVAFTLLSVYMLVGTEDEASVLSAVTGIAAHQSQNEAELAVIEGPAEPEYMADQGLTDYAEDAYVDDEELIDSATGTDPSPEGGDYGADSGDSSYSEDDIPVIVRSVEDSDSDFDPGIE